MDLPATKRALVAASLLLLTPAASTAAQRWTERGDAPDASASGVQRTLVQGPLSAIEGSLGDGDRQDAFCIRIPDPESFLAAANSHSEPRSAPEIALSLLDGGGRLLAAGAFLHSPALTTSNAARRPRLRGPNEFILVVSSVEGSYSVGLAGAEGCGMLDVVFAVDEIKMDRYCLGNPEAAGNFHCHGVTGDAVRTSDVALADFDTDGELDGIFATSETTEPNRICPGDSIGRFSFDECLVVGAVGRSSRGIAVGDLDTDGNEDVLFANAGGEPIACLGDGSLGFSCAPVEATARQGRAAAVGHLDDDGNLDAVFANLGEPSRACFGDGNGGFPSCVNVTDAGEFQFDRDVALGHFDNDGNLDVALATLLGGSTCLGNGAGAFACTNLAFVSDGTAVAAGLLDGDSNLDLVFTQSFDLPRACLGDGLGNFSCVPFGAGHPFGIQTGVVLADFDNDGTLDAAISAVTLEGSLCFGDGSGSFGDCTAINENYYRAEGLAVGALAPASVGHDDFETGDLRAWAASLPDG